MRSWLVMLVACFLPGFVVAGHPTDASMIATFQAHEAEFIALVAMLDADRELLTRSATSIGLENFEKVGVPPSRVAAYRQLLSRLGATQLRFFPDYGIVSLLVSVLGFGPTSSTKSYVYRPNVAGGGTVDDTDSYLPKPGEGYDVIEVERHIAGNWFIHLDAT